MRDWVLYLAAAGILIGRGCTVEVPSLCRFKSGDADVRLESLDGGVASQDGYIYLSYSGVSSCVHHLRFDDGSDFSMVCTAGDPVNRCSLYGTCVDPATDSEYACQGEVTLR